MTDPAGPIVLDVHGEISLLGRRGLIRDGIRPRISERDG